MISLLLTLVCFFLSFVSSNLTLYSRDIATVDNTTGSSPETELKCVRGTNIGAFIIDQPNRTSILIVGANALIRWHYTPLVKNPPSLLV